MTSGSRAISPASRVRAACAAILLAAAVASLSAQRPHSATYDESRRIRLEGPVTRVEWATPHAFVFLDVRDATGIVRNWAVEVGDPTALEREGWKASSVHVGDTVTVTGVPARGEAFQALARTVTLKGGKALFAAGPKGPALQRTGAAGNAPAPRWPNGHVRLGAEPGRKGYWGAPAAHALVERTTGAAISMNDDGLLTNLSDADRVAPFLPWARALYLHRQRTLLKDDPLGRCMPPGGPRQFQMANGFQFIEQPDLGRILVLHGGGDRNWRVIYTDGRPQDPPAEVVASYYGHSVGHWEGDTLVVDSVGFNEKFWMSAGGLPHTEALHLVERFTRPTLNTLKYEVRVEDPRTYTRPWTGGWDVPWVPDRDLQEYFCEENVESTLR